MSIHKYNRFVGGFKDGDGNYITCTDEGIVCPVCKYEDWDDEGVTEEAHLGGDGDKGQIKCKGCGAILKITMMAALYRYKAERMPKENSDD